MKIYFFLDDYIYFQIASIVKKKRFRLKSRGNIKNALVDVLTILQCIQYTHELILHVTWSCEEFTRWRCIHCIVRAPTSAFFI